MKRLSPRCLLHRRTASQDCIQLQHAFLDAMRARA